MSGGFLLTRQDVERVCRLISGDRPVPGVSATTVLDDGSVVQITDLGGLAAWRLQRPAALA